MPEVGDPHGCGANMFGSSAAAGSKKLGGGRIEGATVSTV